ncbi:MAG: adenylyl-sulfate kinase [Chthoniobacteraceae bacterium]
MSAHRPGAILWLTGLSGSGKTTIATGIEQLLASEGVRACVLDGDDLRRGLSSDLGFSAEDRAENMRRAAEVARLLAHAGLVVIVALISPIRDERRRARETARAGGVEFAEIFLDCPLAICEQRDPKGLYKKARAGEIGDFTGVSAAYEPPDRAELVVRSGEEPPEDSVSKIMACLRSRLREG